MVARTAMIAAMAQNRVIGLDNRLPWHLSDDLKRFKQLTLGKPIVMGRKTFDSIGRPLPGRDNLVVSRDPDFHAAGVEVFTSVRAALARAQALAAARGADEVMVIGGAQLYSQLLPEADRLYLTVIDADVDGDAWFPAFSAAEWREVARDQRRAEHFGYSFRILERAAEKPSQNAAGH
ncbi:MAG: dihydrofolate reductase [Spongiibacteraceae bacterium]|jgi:dihydrofolate reductase|nr:dihydrofolate reductase [Spongiibacteraceae bacterium]